MRYLSVSLLILIITLYNAHSRLVNLDENWICGIKMSCVDCLQLEHCSWCSSSKQCFSEKTSPAIVCNDTVKSYKYEMSLHDNALCACGSDSIKDNCRPAGLADGPVCSGRGTCICGKCFCNLQPEPEKVIIGEHCEFDNFSCDGPKCNEGPYSINDLHLYAKANADDVNEEQSVEI